MTPRGEKIKFSNPELSLKWDSATDKTVMKDNDERQLYTILWSYATFPKLLMAKSKIYVRTTGNYIIPNDNKQVFLSTLTRDGMEYLKCVESIMNP